MAAGRDQASLWALFFCVAIPLSTARGEGLSAASALISSGSAGNAVQEDQVRVEPLSPRAKPPTFVLRGGPGGPERMVFLHGMCGHALGYAQSFQFTAARRGKLVAPQGDKPCQAPWSSWSNDLDALDTRIVEAFHRLGQSDPIEDVVVIGYSQGAMRAEDLARRWPHRYTRLVLIASPRVSSPRGFDKVRSTVMMAGERDRQDLMKQSARALLNAGIPSTFMVLPLRRQLVIHRRTLVRSIRDHACCTARIHSDFTGDEGRTSLHLVENQRVGRGRNAEWLFEPHAQRAEGRQALMLRPI